MFKVLFLPVGLVVLLFASTPLDAQSISGPLAGGLQVASVDAAAFSLNVDVSIGSVVPLVGFGLTNEFDMSGDITTGVFAVNSNSPGGTAFPSSGSPYYGVALLDTGAQIDLLTDADRTAFNVEGLGFAGSYTVPIGGATGFVNGTIEDPLGIYAAGLQQATGTGPLVMNTAAMRGQTNVSLVSLPAISELPSVVGIPMISQYTTVIRNDQPQILNVGGEMFRSPSVEFLSLGEGANQGIVRRAPMHLAPGQSFLTPPAYFPSFLNVFELWDDPSTPTALQGGFYLTVNAADGDDEVNDKSFIFDTGAEVTFVSQLVAAQLGFDPVLDEPEFVVDLTGSGGTATQVPGFVADEFEVVTVGGSFVLHDVPLVVLDVVDSSDPGNIVPGIVGMNLFKGRNLVIDPSPALGGGGPGPSIYISDSVLDEHTWATTAASGIWSTTNNWNAPGTPGELWVAHVANVSGSPQQAVVAADSTVNEVIVSGSTAEMKVVVNNGVTLTAFSEVNIRDGGKVDLQEGTLSADIVSLFGGSLTGEGTVVGDVTNFSGVVSPGNSAGVLFFDGSYAQRKDATLALELGGLDPESDYDNIVVEGPAFLDGELAVSLDNFDPALNDSFDIVTATDSVFGTFSLLDLPVLDAGLMWHIDYGSTIVTLDVIAAVLGDMNGDGVFNIADAGPFVMALTNRAAYDLQFQTVNADLQGDMNTDGRFDFGDIVMMSSLLSAAGESSSQSVPEPSTLLLSFFGIALVAVRSTRRRLR